MSETTAWARYACREKESVLDFTMNDHSHRTFAAEILLDTLSPSELMSYATPHKSIYAWLFDPEEHHEVAIRVGRELDENYQLLGYLLVDGILPHERFNMISNLDSLR